MTPRSTIGVTPRSTVTVAAATALVVAAAVGWALAPTDSAVPRLALPVGRLLLDGCGVAAVGLAVLGRLVAGGQRRDADGVRTAAGRAAVVLAGCWAAVALVLLWLQAADVAGLAPSEVTTRAVTDYVAAFGAGTALVVTAGCAVVYGALAFFGGPASGGRALGGRTSGGPTSGGRAVGGRTSGGPTSGRSASGGPAPGRSSGLLGVVAVLGLLPGPLTGHASTAAAHELAVVSVAVHAAAAAVWVGGLGALLTLVAARRTLLATALPRFSPIAAGALAAVAVSGVITATARLGSVAALVDTGYGRVVLVKTAALGVLAVLGALTRRRVLPAVRTHRKAPLVALAGAEIVVMAVALGLAAALTRAAI